jgi:hypothetical protein
MLFNQLIDLNLQLNASTMLRFPKPEPSVNRFDIGIKILKYSHFRECKVCFRIQKCAGETCYYLSGDWFRKHPYANQPSNAAQQHILV